MLSTSLIEPVELSDDELDSVAAASGGGTTIQVGIASAQADDDSNAALVAVGNQST